MKDTFKVIGIWIVLWSMLEFIIIPGTINIFSLGVYSGVVFGYLFSEYSNYLEKERK